MMLKSIKNELKSLNYKNYLAHQLDPQFKDLEFIRFHNYENYFEIHILGEHFRDKIIVQHENIVKIDINGINVYIELKNGTSYFLKEMRNNLIEIFTDFKKHDLDVSIDCKFYIIKDYSLMRKDADTYILRGIKIFDDDDGELEENEYTEFVLEIKFSDIKELDEECENGYHNLFLKLQNDKYLEFTAEWGDR